MMRQILSNRYIQAFIVMVLMAASITVIGLRNQYLEEVNDLAWDCFYIEDMGRDLWSPYHTAMEEIEWLRSRAPLCGFNEEYWDEARITGQPLSAEDAAAFATETAALQHVHP